ncbi:hypothetical protein JHK82_047794 [Glycine max]|nr:hypothetical protein JHK82_047794 [Glycine max]
MNESSVFNLTVTKVVEPFGVCYPVGDLIETRVGLVVPTINHVMHNEDMFWRVFGGNSMVRVAKGEMDVCCLGFVDGGTRERMPVVIRGHQLKDNLMQFDLDSNKFSFTSTMLLQDKVLDAAEAADKQTLFATSKATSRAISNT